MADTTTTAPTASPTPEPPHQGQPHEGQPHQGEPHQGQPPHAQQPPPQGQPDPQQPQQQHRSGVTARTWLIAGALAVVAVLFVALGITILRSADDGLGWWGDDDRDHRNRDGRVDGRDRVATAPLDGRDRATFEVLSSASLVSVTVADLGDGLVRAETPEGTQTVPRLVTTRDRARLELLDTDRGGGASTVEVRLSSKVLWTVRFLGGATEHEVDLRDGRVAGVEFVAGVSRIDLTLPKPDGTVVVRMSGGTNSWSVHLPAGVPARVQANGGASSVTIDGNRRTGLGGGTVVQPDEWAGAEDRYDLDATAGVSTVTVDRY